jgi:general secretion pathway protein K
VIRVPERECGAALLAVLLLVAIMGAIAAGAFERLRLSTALAVNHSALDQARAYAVGVETLLAMRADDVAAQSPEVTTLEGDWNGGTRSFPLPGGEGVAEATIRDGGNCFNLNSLAEGEPPLRLAARQAGVEQFVGLMTVLGVAQGEAAGIAAAAADWIDSGLDPLPLGAEDGAYAGAARPYRPSNTIFAEVSELRAVAGVTPDLYGRLRPHLCALPSVELSPINLNTLLPQDAPLLAMLAPGRLGIEQARAAIGRRPGRGWRSKDEFQRSLGSAQSALGLDRTNQLQLRTRWFALDLRVEVGRAELIETALIDARQVPARVVVRRWGRDE